ncbi:hypothetical protein Adt_05000 [Abeliophyllum distichum]|uniref:Uncharacterized protein n=1 Tax=Abeliophyllum distichum TaxID=126358 RepID=A0ABD1V2X0_9LAMI
MVGSFLLWKKAGLDGKITSDIFRFFYHPVQAGNKKNPQPGYYYLIPRSKSNPKLVETLNKVKCWKESFFFVRGNWEFQPADSKPQSFIPRFYGELRRDREPHFSVDQIFH